MSPTDSDRTTRLTRRYDREAEAYRDLWGPVLRVAGQRLLREISTLRVRRLLDVGTGVGALLPDICSAFPDARVVGVDRSRGMLALCPPKFPRAVMDASQLAIAGGSVDLVLLVFVLFHLPDPLAGLRQARGALRAGGRVATITWAGELESVASRIWHQCLDAHGADPPDPDSKAQHEPVDTADKVQALLAAAGFVNIRTWSADLTTSSTVEDFVRLRTSLGPARLRFESLEPEARQAFRIAVRKRLQDLTPPDFVARGKLVCAEASAGP